VEEPLKKIVGRDWIIASLQRRKIAWGACTGRIEIAISSLAI
jgi:hypothetical protein